jgi:hypothetical protein
MSSRELPRDVEAFIRAHIRSVTQLEVLLLLHKFPERWWTPEEVDRELRSAVATTRQHLDELCKAGLVAMQAEAAPTFRFAPTGDRDRAVVDALSERFRTHFHTVVETIYTPGRGSLQDFADAFTFKKGGQDDG